MPAIRLLTTTFFVQPASDVWNITEELFSTPFLCCCCCCCVSFVWWIFSCHLDRSGKQLIIIITTTTTTIIIIIIIIIMIMIIILTFKGAIRYFYNLLTAPRTVSNTYGQVARAQSCANHVQHIERLSRATCSVPLGTKRQLLNLTELKSHLFKLYFIG